MNAICLAPDKLLALLDEIGRHRALSDEETDLIEAIVTRGHQSGGVRFRWTMRLDMALERAATTRGGIQRFASRHGISAMAAHKRIEKLRKGKVRQPCEQG